MSGAKLLEPYRTGAWPEQAREAIDTMRKGAAHLPLQTYPLGADPAARGCHDARDLDLVARSIHFKAKGEDRTVIMRLQRIVFVHFLRAMIEAPHIVVGFGAGTTATYRSNAMQTQLYDAYLAGGYLAAPPCSSFHELGKSIDGFLWTDEERGIMREHGFYDLLPQDPPHMTYGVRG